MPDDITGGVAVGIDALAQRVTQALRLVASEWFLNRQRGIRRELILGHNTSVGLAVSTLTQAGRDEGGTEILEAVNPRGGFDTLTRTLRYSVQFRTIYGDMLIAETFS